MRALAQRGRCAVITDAHAVVSVLAEIEREAGIGRDDVHVVARAADGSVDQQQLDAAVASQDTIVVTSGVASIVEPLGLPDERLAELGFQLTTATLRELDRRWADKEGEA